MKVPSALLDQQLPLIHQIKEPMLSYHFPRFLFQSFHGLMRPRLQSILKTTANPEPAPSQPEAEDADTSSDLSDVPDESHEDISAATTPLTNTSTAAPAQ